MADKTYTLDQLNAATQQAVQNALEQQQPLYFNAADDGMRQRIAAAVAGGGYDGADTLHNIYCDYGYPAQLDFSHFWNMWRRFGVAGRAISAFPDQTWLDTPTVESKNAAFTRDLDALNETHGVWRRLKGLDVRQRVGRYAGMFMRVRDSKKPNEPIEGKLGGTAALVDMLPLFESQLRVVDTQDDPEADDFGQPTMYEFVGGVEGDRNERTVATTFQIHPSRIVIAAEGADNGSIYGIPVLENVFNDLMDLRKTLGGGAEGFYKNAAQSIVFNLKDGASAKGNAKLLEKFNDNYDDFARNRSRRSMWTPGMEANTLDSTLISPKDFADVSLMAIAAGVGTPSSVLIGNQTGVLAGEQDTKAWLASVQARRLDFGTDMAKALIDWFIRWGILPSAEYTIEWEDAQAPSSEVKLGNADKMADINKKQFESGGVVPFSGEEIREAAGHDPEPTGLPDLPLPDESLDDDIPKTTPNTT